MTDDPTSNRPLVLDELDSLDFGPAPVGGILHAGRTARRRRRAVVASFAAVTALLVGGGLVTAQVDGEDTSGSLVADGSETTPSHADAAALVTHTLTVDIAYRPEGGRTPVEGAVYDFRLEREGSAGPVDDSEVVAAPRSRAWTGLPPGEYTLHAAQRFSEGPATALSQRVNPCERTVTIDASMELAVTFTNTSPCTITRTARTPAVDGSDPVSPEATDLDVVVETDPSRPMHQRGVATWNAQDQVLSYVSGFGYDSCVDGTVARTDEGGVDLTIGRGSNEEGEVCLTYSAPAVATITGLTGAPDEITVTEDGAQRTVEVIADDSADGSETAPTPARLTAVVSTPEIRHPFWPGAVGPIWARWSDSQQTLTFGEISAFSRACLPEASATLDGREVNLTLSGTADAGDRCLFDRRFMMVTITGLSQAPTDVVVTRDGAQRTVEVVTSSNDGADGPEAGRP